MPENQKILLTGAAGFIGAKTAEELIQREYDVLGIDNLNDYYDVRLKRYRLQRLNKQKKFNFQKCDIEDRDALSDLFAKHTFTSVINLAARAGVRYSLENPFVYLSTNAQGTLNLLELCRKHNVRKYVLASTSSLYAGQSMPFKESLPVNEPISPYAASKKAAEAMCYAYHHLYDIDVSILRYFTVYGPAGRPDMSVFRFIEWIDQGKPIQLYGDGTQSRDFTFVEDIAVGTVAALKPLGYQIINLGGNKPYVLNDIIARIEDLLGKKATIQKLPFHKADLMETWADISKAYTLLDWTPKTSLKKGLEASVQWYRREGSHMLCDEVR